MAKKFKFMFTLLIISTLLFFVCAITPLSVYALDPVGPYTATLWYYDDVQITYTLNYPNGGVWNGSGDIPIGGTGLSGQIYCVDPFVHFHAVADTTWDDDKKTTLDTMEGYTLAAPWTVSGALQQNDVAIRWLVLNGYRGDYLNDDSESIASVARLNALYPGIGTAPITKKIALMATKVAIWKIIAGENVVILRTSLNPVEKQVFDVLVAAMINDAQNSVNTGARMTEFNITIDGSGALPTHNSNGFDYYGPFTVIAELTNTVDDINLVLDKVFLNVSGPETAGIEIVHAPESAALANDAKIYGTNDTAYYLSNGDFSYNGGKWTSGDFYLKVPDTRDPPNGDILTIKAMAKAGDVTLTPGTPITFVYEQDSVHDWNYVQAYIGAAYDGMQADLYAEAGYNTGETSLGSIYIAKYIENGSPLDTDAEFRFRLYHSSNATYDPVNDIVDLSHYSIITTLDVDYISNTFTLKNGGSATISGLPAVGNYWVEEIVDTAGYDTPFFDISIAGSMTVPRTQGLVTNMFQIAADDFATVKFCNVKQIPKAHLYIGKIAMEYFSDGREAAYIQNVPFVFLLECSSDGGDTWDPVDLTGIFTSDAINASPASDGTFMLETNDMAFIEVDPDKLYRITEISSAQEYTVMYAFLASEYDDTYGWMTTPSTHESAPDWGTDGIHFTTETFEASSDSYYWFVFSNIKVTICDLSISKIVAGETAADDTDKLFKFQVVCMGNQYGIPAPLAIPVSTITSGSTMTIEGIGEDRIETDENGAPTIFSLKSGETATIKDLLAGPYMIYELTYSGYAVTYTLGTGSNALPCENGATGVFGLLSDTQVTFINTVSGTTSSDNPDNPGTGTGGRQERPGPEGSLNTETEAPVIPNLPQPIIPDEPRHDSVNLSTPADGMRAPQTGDDYSQTTNILLLLIGLACLAGTFVYWKHKKKAN